MTDPARPNEVDHVFPEAAASRRALANPDAERQELDHRLANSLQLAADFLIFEHMRVTDPRARAALIETAERLSAVGQMHRFLAAQRQAMGVDLNRFLIELGVLIGDSTGLDCQVDADPVIAPGEVAQQLAIVINELAMNAAKHAYAWGDRGVLNVICRRQGGKLVVTVADEGEGLDQRFAAGHTKGLGMSIIEAIVRQLMGTLEAVSDHGARFTITLPLPPSGAAPSRSFSPPEPT
ncbi:MAG TPA: ATP-binding protein [Phenylobacterium sp.]|nr:ATP-binding protein [Phenylobacterium sp.]